MVNGVQVCRDAGNTRTQRQQRRHPAKLSAAIFGTAAAAAGGFAACFAMGAFVGTTPAPVSVAALRGGIAGRPEKLAMASYSGQEAKAVLFELLNDKELMKEVVRPEGKSSRGRLDEAIIDLERVSPIEEPAYSELLDGRWQLKYAGWYAPGLISSPTRELALFLYGGGFSLAGAVNSFADSIWGKMVGLTVGEMTVTISDGREVRSTAEYEIGGGWKETIGYTGELMPLSGRRLTEDIVSVDVPASMGKLDSPMKIQRGILVTYLDEELMIVRDESGVAEVLKRSGPPGGGAGDSPYDFGAAA